MDYEILFARLATTEKLPDRFLNTQLRGATDLSKSSMGQIYWLIEILTPWFPTAQIGQTIINTFTQNYYNGGSTSDLVNFEEALKKVNETLAQITQNGETDWIGNLNGVLGITVGNKLHLAQTGKCEAYIFRDGKVDQLTYGLSTNTAETHPLKTFSNITSGELKSHDKIVIANPEFYKHFSTENLQQIVSLNDPNTAILQIAKILKKKKDSSVNVLIMNLLDREEMAKITEDKAATVYLDRPLESFWAGSRRLWQQLVYPILKFFANKSQKAGKKSLNFTKNYVKTLQEKRKSKEPVKKKDLFDKEFIEGKPSDDLLKDEEIQYSPELEVHYYNEKKKQKDNKILNAYRAIKKYILKFWEFIIRAATGKKSRPYFYIAVAIILLVVIGLIINGKRNSSSNLNLAQAQSVLSQAEAAQNDAKNAELSNNPDKAKTLFQEAIDKAKSIQNFPIVSSDAKNVINGSYAELDKMTLTARFGSLDALENLKGQINAVIVSGGEAYLVSQNTLYKALLSGGEAQEVATIPKTGGDFIFATLMGNDIFLYTSSQKIYDFQLDKEGIDLAQGPNTWETASAGTNFAGNLYLLDGIIGQIYKHTSTSKGFAQGQNYINSSSIDLKGTVSMTIDGAIYVLRSNGQAIKLQSGKLQDFSLKDIPTPNSKIDKPLKIYTDADTPSIYVLDGGQKRILEFDKSGHFTHQYALPDSFNAINDFFVSYKSKKIWVVNDKSLYEISI